MDAIRFAPGGLYLACEQLGFNLAGEDGERREGAVGGKSTLAESGIVSKY